jgi:glycolate oxidase
MSNLMSKLKEIISPKYLSEEINLRHAYSRVVDSILTGVPDVVIRPKDSIEVSEILKIANEESSPVFLRGGGCCEFGGSKPIGDGGILLDLKRMTKRKEFLALYTH